MGVRDFRGRHLLDADGLPGRDCRDVMHLSTPFLCHLTLCVICRQVACFSRRLSQTIKNGAGSTCAGPAAPMTVAKGYCTMLTEGGRMTVTSRCPVLLFH